eukprot:1504817-Rhodomonas_salina.1
MARWFKAAGGFDWDMYSREGWADSVAGALRCCTFSQPAGDCTFEGLTVWGFPPPELAYEAVAAAKGWGAAAVWLLVPVSVASQD